MHTKGTFTGQCNYTIQKLIVEASKLVYGIATLENLNGFAKEKHFSTRKTHAQLQAASAFKMQYQLFAGIGKAGTQLKSGQLGLKRFGNY